MPFDNETGTKAGRIGSRKGTPNKFTQEFRDRVMMILDDNWDAVAEDIKVLKGKDKIDAILRLLEFALPKLARTEFRDITDIEELLSMSADERKAEILRLRK